MNNVHYSKFRCTINSNNSNYCKCLLKLIYSGELSHLSRLKATITRVNISELFQEQVSIVVDAKASRSFVMVGVILFVWANLR